MFLSTILVLSNSVGLVSSTMRSSILVSFSIVNH